MRSHHCRVIASGLSIVLALPLAAVELPFGSPTTIVSVLNGPNGLAVGDLNGDGNLDVVTCSYLDQTVRISSGLGGGAWAHGNLTTSLHSPTSLAVGDLDGDGDGDIVVGQSQDIPYVPPHLAEDAELLWLRNPVNGGGGWTLHAIAFFVDDGMNDIVTADIDGDGDIDIGAGYGMTHGGHAWFENDGSPADGLWTYHSVDTVATNPVDLTAADLDRDGDIDLLAAEAVSDTVRWFENDDGVGGTWTAHMVDDDFSGATSVKAADINGDGELDLVATELSGNRVAWYELSGATWTQHSISLVGGGPTEVLDFDFDGDMDIVVALKGHGAIWWFENLLGDGSDWTPRMLETGLGRPMDLAVSDVDGDGDPDMVATRYDDDLVSWWENEHSHHRFLPAEPILVRESLADPRAVEVADINGDGLPDIVTGLWTGDEVTAYLQLSPTLWLESGVGTGFDRARDVSIGDINGDGAPDIIGAAVGGDAIKWWENSGSAYPSWTQRTVLAGFNGAHRAVPADFDGDGDLDLAVAAYDGDAVSWVENVNGAGTSWTEHPLAFLDGAFGLAVGDFNHDGKPDIAATGYDDDAVEVYLNGGASSWSLYTLPYLVDGPRGIDTADLDDDGDLDLVVVVRLDNDILWYENSGSGSGWTEHDVGTGSFTDGAAVRAADLDHDNDVDIVATSQSGDDVYLWFNDGDGASWTRNTFEQSLDSPWDVFVADIDTDGRQDLVVAAGGVADSISWYPNIGGQYSGAAWSVAPSRIVDGEKKDVLFTVVTHQGRAGWDPGLELSTIGLRFEDPLGGDLTSTEINNIVEQLQIYRDTDRDLWFSPAVDTLVHTDTYLSLTNGALDLVLTDGLAELEVAPGVTWGYFVVLTATSDASYQQQREVVVTIQGDLVWTEDRDHDLRLAGEPMDDRATGVIIFGETLFADDFESGGTSAWSSVIGG